MNMIVSKFGGTSLADAERIRHVCDIVQKNAGRRFIVVSAPGKRFDADEKVTDLLIRAYRGDDRALYMACDRFREMADALNLGMEAEIRALEANLRKNGEDYAVSRGEYLSARMFAKHIGYEFVDAQEMICFRAGGSLDAGATYERTLLRLKPLKNAIIPGFYGALPDGTVRTFPRGGSDITGALVAGAMGASVYENWTDVDGFMSADPKLVENTKCVPTLSYRQMRLLSSMGAQVLHPQSLLPVSRAGIPTHLRNTFAPEKPGTVIATDARADMPCITGRALKSGRSVIAVLYPDAMRLPGKVLDALETEHIRPLSLCAQDDHLLIYVRASHFPDAVRSLHRSLVE
jgi:aspartate kinase